MRLHLLSLLAAATQRAYALSDTSPFFLFSTSELLIPSKSSLQSAASITGSLQSSLNQCPSQFYILVSQFGVSSTDFSHRRSAPSLGRALSGDDASIRSSVSINDVVGRIVEGDIAQFLMEQCGAQIERVDMSAGSFPVIKDTSPRVEVITFPTPPSSNKPDTLLANDAFLASFIDSLPSQNYTVIYTTTSPSTNTKVKIPTEPNGEYEMDASPLQEPMHMDLKRDVGGDIVQTRVAAGDNFTLPEGALFNRYQYFSPGLFMGFLVLFPILLIAYFGVRALMSLEVSYAAFDKETGPQSAGQKKQQ